MDPAALLRIKTLELQARTVVDGFVRGLHHSPIHGFSAEFVEYRQYAEGDDPRYIDWRVCARTDKHYIRKHEEETNLDCTLVFDCSASMQFAGSVAHSKFDYGRSLVATLAYYLNRQGESVGLSLFDEDVLEQLPCSRRGGHLHRIFLALERQAVGEGTSLSHSFERLVRAHRRRGLMVLFSDLLVDPEQLDERLGQLTALGHEVVIFRVLDRREIDFAFTDPEMIEDLETGAALVVDPAAARDSYRKKFDAHAGELRAICISHGVQLHTVVTDEPLELALYEFLKDRKRLGRLGQRARV